MTQTQVRRPPPTSAVAPGRLPGWGGSYAEAVIDLDAIRHNTALLSRAATGGLMAVVKANGFGHGAVQVARTALASGAGWLGVTSLAEAEQLRRARIEEPVLAWMHLPTDDVRAAIRHRIDLSVSSLEHLEALAAGGRQHRGSVQVHLKVDTGLHRNGADPAGWQRAGTTSRRAAGGRHVRVRGVWSHLARADEPGSLVTGRQVQAFDAAVAVAREAGLEPTVLHLANSAALLRPPPPTTRWPERASRSTASSRSPVAPTGCGPL